MTELVNEIVKCNTKIKPITKNYYLQINIGKENQKSGVYPEDLKFICEKNFVIGLMCIPPMDKQSKDFNEMKSLRNKLNPNLLLSMGMSNDYKVSLEWVLT